MKFDIFMDAMSYMDYDVMNLGKGDIQLIDLLAKEDAFPLISANLNFKDKDLSKSIFPFIIKTVNNITIGITGVMDGATENTDPDVPFQIIDPTVSLKKIIPHLQDKTDFIILLSQLRGKETLDITRKIPGIHLALCIDNATLSQPGVSNKVQSSESAKTKVMNLMLKGREIGIIKISKHLSKIKIESTKRLLLDQDKQSDQYVLTLLQKYTNDIGPVLKEMKKAEEHNKRMEHLKTSPEAFFKKNSVTNTPQTKETIKKQILEKLNKETTDTN